MLARGPSRLTVQGTAVQALGLRSIWQSTGIGPAVSSSWAQIAVFPPFSWVNWLGVQFTGAPAFYRYYLYYTLANSLAKRLCPGLHAQVVTGTTLGLVKSVSPDRYYDSIAGRLRALLLAQARLRAPAGQPAQPVPPRVLDEAAARLKSDPVLTEALGSTAALAMWHKLERTPWDDPALLRDSPPNSQSRWILEALRAGYLEELEAGSLGGELEAAGKTASRALEDLRTAVGAAARCAEQGVFEAVDGAGSLAEVEKASRVADNALSALEAVRAKASQHPAAAVDYQSRWETKLQSLLATHADAPLVAAELKRLVGVAPLRG